MEAYELIFIGNVKINNSLKDTSKQGGDRKRFTSHDRVPVWVTVQYVTVIQYDTT